MNPLPHRLRVARARTGLSSREVAARVQVAGYDMTDRAVRYYERGDHEPSLSRAAALADALGVSVDWLLGRRPLSEPLQRAEARAPEMVEGQR